MKLSVIGDSITYLAKKYGAIEQFAEHGIEASLDGKPGARADSPTRYEALKNACIGLGSDDILILALGTNDMMYETFLDEVGEQQLSTDELANIVGHLHRGLAYSEVATNAKVFWINITERTMKGYYNQGAKLLNKTIVESKYPVVDWNGKRAHTSDTIHPTRDGVKLWVEAILEAIEINQ